MVALHSKAMRRLSLLWSKSTRLRPQTFADFKTYLQAKGLKVNAIAKRLAIFSAIGKQAVKAGLLSSNVLLKFESVK
jgi:hypothetical protein